MGIPKFCWADNIPTISPDCKYTHQYEEFIDLLNEFSLTQLVTQPTRFENILDLFLIDNPTLVKSVDIKPGIADHDAVLSKVYIKPQVSKQKPRLMFIYKKTDWEGLENHMHREEIKGALHSGIEKHVPQHTISTKPSLPWMTQEIKRTIRKRDSLYDKYKRLRRPTDRCAFLEAKHLVKQKLKQAHNRYIEEILGLTNSLEQSESNCQSSPEPHKSTLASKKLFSLLKNSKQDSKGIAPSKRTVRCTLILWTRQTS